MSLVTFLRWFCSLIHQLSSCWWSPCHRLLVMVLHQRFGCGFFRNCAEALEVAIVDDYYCFTCSWLTWLEVISVPFDLFNKCNQIDVGVGRGKGGGCDMGSRKWSRKWNFLTGLDEAFRIQHQFKLSTIIVLIFYLLVSVGHVPWLSRAPLVLVLNRSSIPIVSFSSEGFGLLLPLFSDASLRRSR